MWCVQCAGPGVCVLGDSNVGSLFVDPVWSCVVASVRGMSVGDC